LDQIRKSVETVGLSGKITYYIIYDEDGLAVGVGCLTNYDQIGYISNLATLSRVRGQGYGKALTNYLVEKSINTGNKTHCLATVLGSEADKFYRHLGFEEMMRAKYYTK
ncbi:MAG: GNAT family N-acetyltransferase, partial [Pseudomonadales bacterium]|nr:GNAT family N-acetyltransferase [Pseudomonadales bacterium]